MCCTSSELTRLAFGEGRHSWSEDRGCGLNLCFGVSLQDIKAYHSLPLPGYMVKPVSVAILCALTN